MSDEIDAQINVSFFVYKNGEFSARARDVLVRETDRVRDLKRAIGQDINLSNTQFALWKPKSYLSQDGLWDLRSRFSNAAGKFEEFCDVQRSVDRLLQTVSQLFSSTTGSRSAKRTAVVAEIAEAVPIAVKRPASQEGDDEEMPDPMAGMHKRFKANIEKYKKMISSQPPKYPPDIQSDEIEILDGRYTTEPKPLGLPVELYHSAFAHFRAVANDETLEPLVDDVLLTRDLMHAASQISHPSIEKARQSSIREKLRDLLSYGFIQTANMSGPAIVCTRNKKPFGVALLCAVEEQPELGTGGDPTRRGSFSYKQYWIDRAQKDLVDACCCPSFIVAIADAWVCVLGAVLTSHVIVQHLTNFIWLGESWGDSEVVRNARVFTALRQSLQRLETYYASLAPPEDPHSKFFPSQTSFTAEKDGISIRTDFRYLKYLSRQDPSCNTFLVVDKADENRQLVVKFVRRYGEDVHGHMMSTGRAPQLLYVGAVWPDGPERYGCRAVRMVVMEYVRGKMLEGSISPAVRDAIRVAVHDLHSQGFVHGDIRPPNILIAEGDGEEAQRVMILDFDWAGREGKARYPLNLNQDIGWPDGVDDIKLIEKKHDLEMLNRL